MQIRRATRTASDVHGDNRSDAFASVRQTGERRREDGNEKRRNRRAEIPSAGYAIAGTEARTEIVLINAAGTERPALRALADVLPLGTTLLL